MIHWVNDVEPLIRANIQEAHTGRVPTNVLVRYTNYSLRYLAKRVLQPTARIVVGFNAGVVTLIEEDWAGTEQVGIPAYVNGLQGAFYIRYCLNIDAIYPLINTGTAALPVWDTRADKLSPLIQQRINEYSAPMSGYVSHYAPYHYTLMETIGGFQASTKVVAIWFAGQFDYSGADDNYRFEVQYRRWGPQIDVSYENGAYTIVQPYIYHFDVDIDLLVEDVTKRIMKGLGDKRYGVQAAEARGSERLARWEHSLAHNLDELPTVQNVDEPLREYGPDL